MNALLKQPEPGASPTAWGGNLTLPDGTPVRRPTVVEPRAHILYVDDEPELRKLGELVLVQSGYDVDTAENGAEAWVALNEVSFNLLITDDDMPRLTGRELVIQARRAGMRLPIVMTAGSLSLMHGLACAWPDLTAFLPKPFAPDALVETVGQILRTAKNSCQYSGTIISALGRIARSAHSYPHGGINE